MANFMGEIQGLLQDKDQSDASHQVAATKDVSLESAQNSTIQPQEDDSNKQSEVMTVSEDASGMSLSELFSQQHVSRQLCRQSM